MIKFLGCSPFLKGIFLGVFIDGVDLGLNTFRFFRLWDIIYVPHTSTANILSSYFLRSFIRLRKGRGKSLLKTEKTLSDIERVCSLSHSCGSWIKLGSISVQALLPLIYRSHQLTQLYLLPIIATAFSYPLLLSFLQSFSRFVSSMWGDQFHLD